MILPPINDQGCLGPITEIVRALVSGRDPNVVALAAELGTVEAAIRWIRSLPQRDDTGAEWDRPKVAACDTPQRLRIPAPDPNCVERAALYVALAELLAPQPGRRLSTIDVPDGYGGHARHTLPVENGREVVLDPLLPRNAAAAAVDALHGRTPPSTPRAGAEWLCRLASEPARQVVGAERSLRNAAPAMSAMAATGAPVPRALVDDVALVLALAEREAARWGEDGVAVVDRVTRRLAGNEHLAPRAEEAQPALRNVLGRAMRRYRLPRELVRALRITAHAVASVAPTLAVPTARLALVSAGITPAMLAPLEAALRRDGLTLGALATAAE